MSTRKILLADDSVTIQKVVNLTFADEDIEVITVGDGDAAMQKFTEITPDLVMADVNMPGLDGYRICEALKQDDKTKHIPVILLVGSFEPFDEEEARRVGADDFLTKPFQSIRQLVNKVSDLLNVEEIANAENEAAVVNSFDDTLETKPLNNEVVLTENLGDAGMDDEMIQTSQIGSLPTDEAHKFESKPIYQSFAENTDSDAPEQSSDFDNLNESDDWAERQPLLKEDIDDDSSENSSFNKNTYEFADEEDSTQEDLNDQFEQILVNNKNLDAVPEDHPDFALDDFDLLELPQSKKEFSPKTGWQNKFDDSRNPPAQSQTETSIEQVKSVDDSTQINNLSPEMIDAVAEKIVEKISDRVIRKIVREVLAQAAKKK